MKKYFYNRQLFLLFFVFGFLSFAASAQNDSLTAAAKPLLPSKHKIAIFAPLYLDSAFDNLNEYRYAKNVFPRIFNPGLEFYEGAQLALDSLAREGKKLDVYVYDTRSTKETLEQQLNRPEMGDVELIIANCSGNEVWTFAQAALKKNIPVINTTIPHDGGATSNPFFVIMNSTLKTQCEGIYKYIQKYYAIEPLVVFRTKGVAEDQIKNYFDEYSKVTMSVPLKMKYVDLPDSFTVEHLKPHLNDVRRTLCVAGSLDASFGRRLAFQLASLHADYPSAIMGMPTWDGIRDFARSEFKGPEIIYSTPFYNARMDKVSQEITNYFNNTIYARPSDMVFRGYEATMRFSRLLLQYGKDISSNLGNKQNKIFIDFDIQPVINKETRALEYFENKKLHFIKWQDGAIKGVN